MISPVWDLVRARCGRRALERQLSVDLSRLPIAVNPVAAWAVVREMRPGEERHLEREAARLSNSIRLHESTWALLALAIALEVVSVTKDVLARVHKDARHPLPVVNGRVAAWITAELPPHVDVVHACRALMARVVPPSLPGFLNPVVAAAVQYDAASGTDPDMTHACVLAAQSDRAALGLHPVTHALIALSYSLGSLRAGGRPVTAEALRAIAASAGAPAETNRRLAEVLFSERFLHDPPLRGPTKEILRAFHAAPAQEEYDPLDPYIDPAHWSNRAPVAAAV